MDFTKEETATVLAALRMWQRHGLIVCQEAHTIGRRGHWLDEIATSGGEHAPKTAEQVDALCEKVNCDEKSRADKFVSFFAGFEPYRWTADEGWTCDQGGDAITCMNDMIQSARELVGLPLFPNSRIGEQEEDWEQEEAAEAPGLDLK